MSDTPRFVRGDANGVSEVNCGNLVERHVTHFEEKESVRDTKECGKVVLAKRICGTDGFVDSSFSMRWLREMTCTGRKVNFADLSRQSFFEVNFLFQVETREHYRGVQACVVATEMDRPRRHVKNFVLILFRGQGTDD